jgi:type IV secretion system protein VirB10
VSDDTVQAELPPPTISVKANPEALVLRGNPRPVVRFRRGLIVGVTVAFSSAVVALSWFALEPPSFRKAADEEPTRDPLGKPSLDALAKAPSGYGDVPRLGPPLPGDLGRPILDREPEAAALPAPESTSASIEADRTRSLALEQRQRALAAVAAVRSSPVIVQLTGGAPGRPALQPPESDASSKAAEAEPADGEAGRKAAFARTNAGSISADRIRAAPSPWTLSAGTIIPASLITGLNSDLPGIVIAQVTEPVRDSASGRTVLIPQGARLVGSYDNRVGFGQRRALLIWQRIIFPDASSIDLEKMPATDGAGFAGLADRVDFHTARLLRGIALSTLLGIGTELGIGGDGGLAGALREATQQGSARAGDQLTQRNLDVQPTITVRPGWPVRAIVNKDLVLQPWKG